MTVTYLRVTIEVSAVDTLDELFSCFNDLLFPRFEIVFLDGDVRVGALLHLGAVALLCHDAAT